MTPRSDRASRAGMIAWAAHSMAASRIRTSGFVFYALVWAGFPIFNLVTTALIYRGDPALRDYAIIGGSSLAMLFTMQYNAGQQLDEERQKGTLGNLFCAPAPRYCWLGGFQLYAVAEALVTATLTLLIGVAAFGLDVALNPAVALVTVLLMLVSMWGFSMLVGSVGLAIRNANQLSNLLFPFLMLLSGAMYPIDALPEWAQAPAQLLPFGYAVHALSAAVSTDAGFGDLAGDLLPLTGFAVVLPLLGVAAFGAVERRVRRAGTLELV